jgi:hypothetical protein
VKWTQVMDQDSTKDGSGGGDRRNWRERLGVGQDLPRISDEFKSPQSEPIADPTAESKSDDQPDAPGTSGAKSGIPVARPAPMAPRYARSMPPPAGDGQSPGPKTTISGSPVSSTEQPSDANRFGAGPGSRPVATPSQIGQKLAEALNQRQPGQSSRQSHSQSPRPGSSYPQAPAASGLDTQRTGYSPRTIPTPTPQRPTPPTRGPAAQFQTAHVQTGRSGSASASRPASSSAGNDSFGERLRAQREAAERLAQQRLAAVRDRSATATSTASADTATMTTPRQPESVPHYDSLPPRRSDASAKPAGEQPRFTFAQEEIVAARHETVVDPATPPASEQHQPQSFASPPAYSPPSSPASSPASAPARAEPLVEGADLNDPDFFAGQPQDRNPPELRATPETMAARPASLPDYRPEDDSMFEDAPPMQAVPPRASAADYSAAYREYEDEFEPEPRRGGGPLLLLMSLLAVAAISGGLIYWYLQLDGATASTVTDLPVIAAPEDAAKADPEPVQLPQQAVAPTRRKQIYDRILGQETLEPERLVPTEEEPQLRQIQQQQPPRASGAGQSGSPDARRDQSTEPLPLPLPPPPGAGVGEQGDLLVPGLATHAAARAPQPRELALPPAAGPRPSLGQRDFGSAAVRPTSGVPASSAPETTTATESRNVAPAATSAAAETYPEPSGPLAYPEPSGPLAYPEPSGPLPYAGTVGRPAESPVAESPAAGSPAAEIPAAESPVQQQASEPRQRAIAALPEPMPEPAAEPQPAAEPTPEPTPEPEVVQASDIPLPRAKPEVPVRTTRATPQTQPQRTTQQPQQTTPPPASSGPVQIIPADLALPGQAPAQQPRLQMGDTELFPARSRPMGSDYDPLEGHRTPFSSSSAGDSWPTERRLERPQSTLLDLTDQQQVAQPQQPAQQQVARAAPEVSRSQPEASGGYVVQMSSFRSQSDALGEYQRLVQRHPNLVGNLQSRVQEASLGQSGTFYRLGLGPIADRSSATRLCDQLIAAGEKDCLVRRN